MAETKINLTAVDINVQGRQGLAVNAFYPGHLLSIGASGFSKLSSASTLKQTYVALPNIGRAADLDSVYVAGETAQALIPRRGDELYLWVAAGATAIALGDLLVSSTDGTVKKAGAETGNELKFQALEAVDNSGGSAEARIRVQTL